MQINNRFTGAVLFEGDHKTIKTTAEHAVKSDADLSGANMSGANMSGAEIKFCNFPTKTLLSMDFGDIPEALTVELMCRDAWASPHPEAFIEWDNGSEGCPLDAGNGVERLWSFRENRGWLKKYLDSGGELRPQMRDSDLIKAICKAKGWELPE